MPKNTSIFPGLILLLRENARKYRRKTMNKSNKMPSFRARRQAKMIAKLTGESTACTQCAFMYVIQRRDQHSAIYIGCGLGQHPGLPAPFDPQNNVLSQAPPLHDPPCIAPYFVTKTFWENHVVVGADGKARGGFSGASKTVVETKVTKDAHHHFDFSGPYPKLKNPGPANS